MDHEAHEEHAKLDMTVMSSSRCREIILKHPDQHGQQERSVVIWSRRRELADNVYIDESPSGELRVVKRVALREKSANQFELSVIALIREATRAKNKELFVDFKGWFSHQDHMYFVMEYCHHGDISQCFPNPQPETEARSIGKQLLEALEVLHGLGIVHRDIKPQNVLVAQKNPIKVKVADFGISKIMEGTELKTQLGTFGYIAPEVFGLLEHTGESSRYTYSSAVDIWSLGCLLYSVLTGNSPFPGSSFRLLGDYANGRMGFPEIPLLEKGVSLAGRSFISKLMSPSPERRPKATVDLLDDWIIPLRAAEPPEKPEFPMAKPKLLVTSPTKHDSDQTMSQPLDKQGGYPSNGAGSDITLELPGKVIYKTDMDALSLQLWSLFKGEEVPEDGRERVRIHLESGANPNIVYWGLSVLHLSPSKPVSWLSILLEHGADPHIPDKDGRSPIHSIVEFNSSLPSAAQAQAAASSRIRFEKLMAYGAMLDAQDDKGFTPLIHACFLKNFETTKVLVEQGANVNASCHSERTSLIYAFTPTNITTRPISPRMERVEGKKIVRFLVEQGADINTRCSLGRTALHYVIDTMPNFDGGINQNLAIFFLERGADADVQDNSGRTPLHCVAKKPGNELLVKLLVKSGVDVNRRQNGTVTALEMAAGLDASNGSVIRYLVKHGAECQMKDPIVKRRVQRAQRWLKMSGQI